MKYFRVRAGRGDVDGPPERFERFFVCLYRWEDPGRREVRCIDVTRPPPRARPARDEKTLTLEEVVAEIRTTYDARNGAPDFDRAPY